MAPSDGRRARRYYAYLLRCADGTYYAGYTVDPARRFATHRRGRASRYTRGRGPHRLVAVWRCPTQRAALQLERMLKRLSHAEKERLAAGRALARVTVRARGIGASATSYGNIDGLSARPRASGTRREPGRQEE